MCGRNLEKIIWFETQLHGIRMMMLNMKRTFEEALDIQLKYNPYFADQWKRIVNSQYLEKSLSFEIYFRGGK